MKPFLEVASELQTDGALRDFYVFDISLGHWQTFLDHVRDIVHPSSFVIDGEIAPLPKTINEIRRLWDSASPCLSIPVASGFLCCHFFSDTELELDFFPSDYSTEQNWNCLVTFLTEVCSRLGRCGIICHENMPEQLIETIEPKKAERAGAANPCACGTSGIPPAEQARMPEASRDT